MKEKEPMRYRWWKVRCTTCGVITRKYPSKKLDCKGFAPCEICGGVCARIWKKGRIDLVRE